MTRINRSVLPLFGVLVRARLWPDSSVVAKQTFEQLQLWPSEIKKLVARAERSNEPSTTAQTTTTTTTTTTTPSRSHQQKSLAGFLLEPWGDSSLVLKLLGSVLFLPTLARTFRSSTLSPAYLPLPTKTCLVLYLPTFTPAGACEGDLPTYLTVARVPTC